MKSTIITLLLILTGLFNLDSFAESPKQENKPKISADKIEVYYFHYSRRCLTCQAVENETLKSIKNLYPVLYKSGKITFSSVNLDQSNSKKLAEKLSIGGQTLLVVKGNIKTDLTDKGFLYAKNSPEKLKQELQKVIDPLLK